MFSLISRKNLCVIEVRFFGWDDLLYLLEIHQLLSYFPYYTAQKMKFSIKNFFSKWDQIRRKLRISSYLRKKSLKENFIFCVVKRDRYRMQVTCVLYSKLTEAAQAMGWTKSPYEWISDQAKSKWVMFLLENDLGFSDEISCVFKVNSCRKF